jgi:tetratricopeptide (TPR) repeat protein
VTDSVLVVPFQIGVATERESGSGGPAETAVPRHLLTGRIVLQGERTPFRFEVDEQAEALWLDRFGEVFGRFTAVDRWPRHAALHRGRNLMAEGDLEGAERVLESALSLPVFAGNEAWLGYELDAGRAVSVVDTGIHLGLARILLDDDRVEEAVQQLEAARDTIGRGDRWQFEPEMVALEARSLLLSGQPEAAQRQLKRSLTGRLSLESVEGWALFAVASHVTGRTEDSLSACRHAVELGVDLGPLECP